MISPKSVRRIAVFAISMILASLVLGCGESKPAEPSEAEGYYKGPIKGKGSLDAKEK